MDVQAISPSPFHFMYWLAARRWRPDEPGRERAPGRDRQGAPGPLRGARPRAAAGAGRGGGGARVLREAARLPGRARSAPTSWGREVSRGRDQFWKKAQELDVVVFMHPNGFTQGDRLADHYFTNVIGNPLDTTVALGHLVFDGLLERFPKLKIVAAHGGGYIAHYPARMDHVWGARVDARTVLKKTPRQSLEARLLRHDRVRARATASPGEPLGRRPRSGRDGLSLRHGHVRSPRLRGRRRRS